MNYSEYKKKANEIAKWITIRSDIIASASSGPGLYCVDSTDPIAAYEANPKYYVKPIYIALRKNPSLEANDFFRLSNSVIACALEARNTLLAKILQSTLNASLTDKLKVINNMGEALDIQIGRDKAIFDKRTVRNILKRMEIVGIPPALITDYEILHKYYLSSKHRDEPRYLHALEQLSTPLGREICAKYYESVRKILVSYYQNSGMPLFNELDAIDYKQYDLSI